MEAQLDVNGDGTVSEAEGAGYDEVKEDRQGRHHKRGQKRGQKHGQKHGENGDNERRQSRQSETSL